MADDISRKAGTAGISLFFRKAWGGFLNLFVMAYLARVLSPEDFGLVAISNTLIGFMQVFGNAGIGDYLIYYKGEDESEIQNAAFWLNCLIALFIFIVLLFIAPDVLDHPQRGQQGRRRHQHDVAREGLGEQ